MDVESTPTAQARDAASWPAGGPEEHGDTDDDPGGGARRTERAALVLVARWEARGWLHARLEEHARTHLAAAGVGSGEAEDRIEQQILTEQTEYIAEFFFLLRHVECHRPERLGAFIDRHNAAVDAARTELELVRREPAKYGQRHRQRLERVKAAGLSGRVKAAAIERLSCDNLVLCLKDIERFMAPHMDPSLCRDRLDALVAAGLLEDEVRPNLRLFRSPGHLEAMVGEALGQMLDAVEGP